MFRAKLPRREEQHSAEREKEGCVGFTNAGAMEEEELYHGLGPLSWLGIQSADYGPLSKPRAKSRSGSGALHNVHARLDGIRVPSGPSSMRGGARTRMTTLELTMAQELVLCENFLGIDLHCRVIGNVRFTAWPSPSPAIDVVVAGYT